MPDSKPCVCGHLHEAHEHFRRGTDCGICGAEVCPKYRASRSSTAFPTPPPSPPAPEREQADAATRSR